MCSERNEEILPAEELDANGGPCTMKKRVMEETEDKCWLDTE